MQQELFQMTDKGIYIPDADIYIDPWKPVEKSIITHGHSDHARFGNNSYLCHHLSKPVLKYRLGEMINCCSVEYNESFTINGIKFSLHPAGHIPGSAQIRIEKNGNVLVVSGDYKLENDFLSTPFEPVKCNTFITESTFGLPIFRWKKQSEIFKDINAWWQQNAAQNRASVLVAYSLGKAQRLLKGLDLHNGKIFAHGAVFNMNEVLRQAGLDLPYIERITADTNKSEFKNAMIIAPPSAVGNPWLKKFDPYSLAFCSGWMQVRGNKRRQAIDRGFVVSDHVDWPALNEAVKLTEAEKIYVTHGYTAVFVKWLRENNLDAHELKTEFTGESIIATDDINDEKNIA
ncbi:MAG: ligase-associated DNA damage response exonuclease [Bacteroidetes bacterium]|nr:ligase-associated DNA damage response exonuclease [Bacteroidota bacterium]MBK8486203.1 ligase-associated DNA damage response exonuclease [Bacteroidota bacterium]MBK8681153.1 ligase-associated DNA damage response exonuclease [Bacteroidota bacterium]MBP7399576.1 ligase-associated DNA damage response exonuclease [Chitinophagales bacterium]MBP9190045.1 ligase-associated DNA damage response exonuclease [Chitinophagales bacterium]